MLKGFKEFLSRGNVIDLAVAVVIGAAFTGLVTSFTEKVVQPLVDRVGAGGDREYGFLKISLGGTPEQFVDFNAVLAAFINFLIVAAVIYFVIVLPYKKLRERGEVEQAQDTELSILTEIRDLLAANGSVDTGRHVSGPGTGPSPDTAEYTSADRDK
ncbi:MULTISPECIES: large-conductance mechanosensitive channel protein MscL [Mycolicibacterium]|jgi:large conductance mechanosensitive channel|uniref:Large-conductance mechanosensitive channel n=3 Tax=Mycolicibacterium fortuitum TaxID=1766 RepID=A0A0N9YGE9_MYCFO|nr:MULTISPECIES: large-conductance mechanosensitive channel protein MscL [Mycolicibacterium]AIY48139.1 Large-conductance mechanosensitive channel [Mycobacterium sp. VKM Ac-1817D]CRL82124.1 large-conductance mechanosensitive channel [Mycolicibacter nonchromogenicus]ALI28707.1 Large-conductance mechanosensitive channel [Mycolicibacterium fortuitum]AMD55695.1 mechanosensitive ion channel protein MscL [Mycolicibacterium fortuitum subsp. fortuitum DSM 46621 = ATCC 6841 = JCM 6387]EJZ05494.1 large-c